MKKFHSFIATLLAFSIILSCFSVISVVSAETAEVWDGTAATEFAGGTGTEADPFLIENGGQLYKAVKDLGKDSSGNALYYLITKDIYLNENYENYDSWMNEPLPANEWSGVYGDSYFMGHIDGGYHTVYGLFYKGSGQYRAGLIPWMGGGATLSNLTISNAFVRIGGDAIGVICGRFAKATISNCIVHDSMIYNRNSTKANLGGIVGYAENTAAKIENCGTYNMTFSHPNTVTTSNPGGILGASSALMTVSDCFSAEGKVYENDTSTYLKDAYIFGDANKITCTNSHSDVVGSKNGVTHWNEAPENMMGAGAVANMNLPAKVWKDTESSYPTFVAYDNTNEGVKGQVWTGLSSSKFAGGSGTEADPFLIETAEQLYKAIADNGMYAGVRAYYVITADIYLNSDHENYADWGTTAPAKNWGVTHSSSSFTGYLDGGNHTVYGMYYNVTGATGGLIAYVSGSGATVCNLIVENSYVYTSGDSTAVVAGRLDNGTITNCIARNAVVTNGSSNKTMGGIVGYAGSSSTSTIQNCGAYNITFGEGATETGGILGKGLWPTYIKNSFSGGTFILGYTASGTSCSACYSDTAGSKNGVTVLDSENMQGEGAVANMGLSTTIWKDTEGYPTLAQNNGVKGEVWSGAMASRFAGGSGTEADPYLIETAEQLYKAVSELGKKSDGTAAYYLIIADIYLNSDYENYADWATAPATNNWLPTRGDFIGHLDGGLHTVYGLYSVTGSWRNGLIPYINSGATVSNLIIAKSYVRDNDNTAGAVVGAMYANTKIEKCMVYDAVVSAANNDVGGIVGAVTTNTSTVSNCGTYNLTVSGSSNVGGILGRVWTAPSGANGTRIYSCYSVDNYPLGNTGNIWADYNYSNISGTKNGISAIDKAAMLGEAAVEGMKYLDLVTTWQTVENGYPTLRKASDNNLSQQITASHAVTDNGNAGVKFASKVAMPTINPTYDDNIVITVDGAKKTVSEVGIIISRAGVDVTDITTVQNDPLTGYKVVGYTNGGENADIVVRGGYIIISAMVSGTSDYTAKSYISFADGTAVIGDAYTAEPSTESTTVDGIKVNDTYTKGDANYDGEINIIDLVAIKKYSVLGDSFTAKDILMDIIDTDGDADFAAGDITELRKALLEGAPEAPAAAMSLVFEDNFNTSSVDSTKWDFNDYMAGYDDLSTATTSDVQSIVNDENGNSYLKLTAYKTEDGSYKTVKSITTGNKLTFVNGYVEIRAKVPTVQGAWPSFWLKSNTGNADLGWSSDVAYNTEVDVFEVMGGNSAISELHKWQYDAESDTVTDIRYGSYASRNSYAITDTDWHTYGMLWTENTITMYVDGVAIQTYDLNTDYEGANGLGMDGFKNQPLCITINNHLFTPEYQKTQTNGWTDDKVVGDDFTESVYEIDYVRLYQDETGILYKAN